MMISKKEWKEFAATYAQVAHEHWSSSRWGTHFVKGFDVVLIYNNNPYTEHSGLRRAEIAEFREVLRNEGIKELAYAAFPRNGHSYVIVIDVRKNRERYIGDLMRDAMLKASGGVSQDSSPA